MQATRQGRTFFLILMVFIGWATFMLVRDYIGAIVLAAVLAIVFRPVHTALYRWLGQRTGIATVLTLAIVLAAVLIPLLVFSLLAFSQLRQFTHDLAALPEVQRQLLEARIGELRQVLMEVPLSERLNLEQAELLQRVRTFLTQAAEFLTARVLTAGTSTFRLFGQAIICFITLAGLLGNYTRVVQLLMDLSPLDDAIDRLFLTRLGAMTRAMTRGIIVIAVVQGTVAGILMAVASTHYIVPLTILAILAAVLPLGVSLLTVPVGLLHIFFGNTWQGALIIAGSLFFVTSMDNWLRPRLVSKEAYLNPALVLLSAFGGISLFGFLGVVYGPVIMLLFVTSIEVYLEYFRDGAKQIAAVPPGPTAAAEFQQVSESPPVHQLE